MSGVSNHFDTITVLAATVTALNLSGLTGGVVIQEVATFQDGQIPQPFVSISPYGPETTGDELNDRDGHYYGTAVVILAQNDASLLETRLGWRQTLWRAFNNRSLTDLIELYSLGLPSLGQNYLLKVEPSNAIESQAALDRKGFVSGFIVRANFQEPRQ